MFIYYAKSQAVKEGSYYEFFELETTLISIKVFIKSMIGLFLFKASEPFTSAYIYLLLILVFFLLIQYRKLRITENNLKWFLIFTFDLIIVFIVIISSKWSYFNGVPRRYFVCNYISFWIAFLIVIESMQTLKYGKQFKYFLLLTVLLGGLGTLYNFKYISPKTLKPKIEIVDEFKKLGKIGIISEYWDSYITSCPNPDLIKATPHDQSFVRSIKMAKEVMKQNNIYIIKDMWLEVFPDTLRQFGYMMLKNGNTFNIGDRSVCKYKKVK